ncbi:glycosyltransferase family 20-domain-containing protein [Mycotypha africana]|uniref:glycosyltransferase family 20-domain-containing protein n=1 Tax=Mycotypha africana TaxID=64632 RepID=UPI0023010322|nr:glycosyltransferase family 20-domain-containing protein [Mycotypha africana]KAI8973309.1 glycosyltransferase family 20-domain-containing protein [Mycotypha africana]
MSIDTSKLKELFNYKQEENQLKGKIINVVNQIPYHCFMNRADADESIIEKLRLAVNNADPDDNGSMNVTPISNLERRRRSTVVSLGQTNIWQLSTRKGHSAMYAAIDSLKKDYQTLYIGSTGAVLTMPDKQFVKAETISDSDKESLRHLLQTKHGMIPIFIEDKLSQGHYEGYSKQVLWPLMHYLMWSDKVDEASYWDSYIKVNQIFANEVISNYKEGDIIWVHDYHLLLVPEMIRKVLPNAPIGLFVHTPFPSSEIFRCLPRRKEILQGMLGSSVVAFQTYNYSRHFASNCTRILGYEYTPSGILANGVLIQLETYPIGIDVERTRYHCKRPGVSPKAKAIKERYAGKKIIVGRDKMDPVKGVVQKLEAFETFLTDFPEWRDKVVLIQVTSPGVLDSLDLENKTAEIVARINSRFGSLEFTPCNVFNQHIDRDEYYALLEVADICLVTPINDGMNTASFEYIVAQENHHSPLILSEFTGTARSMGSAVIVNPWDCKEVARAIAECLNLSEEEKTLKYKQLHQFVTSHTAAYWARSLVKGLLKSPTNGFGSTTQLDISRVNLEYKNNTKRAFFFDYDGTLVPIQTNPDDAKPSQDVIDVLTHLSSDPNNTVWVISGRTQKYLEDWLGHIPNLGLSSEHGCFIREPNSNTWVSLMDDMDMSWQDDVKEIFEYYTERTPGSFIEEKRCSLTWHYRKADPKYGAFQARELQNHLEQNVVGKLPVECLVGKMNVEVRPMLINKGLIIKRVMTQHSSTEFVLCAGDDRTDEDMFRILERLEIGGIEVVPFTVVVGSVQRKTLANWKVDSSKEFVSMLQSLCNQ